MNNNINKKNGKNVLTGLAICCKIIKSPDSTEQLYWASDRTFWMTLKKTW